MSEAADAVKKLLQYIDPDPEREGLSDTPDRVARFFDEFYEEKPFKMTTFSNHGYDQMVLQLSIPFYSVCEHHLVPFFGTGNIAYIPNEKIVGLSKLARTLDHFSRRLQTQESITTQVADFLTDKLSPKGVAVVLTGRHLCMEMRGVEKPGTITTTSCLKGVFEIAQLHVLNFLVWSIQIASDSCIQK